MKKTFTEIAFTESVRKEQEKYGTRNAYARMEKNVKPKTLGEKEIAFIESRDSFYMATISENHWPYVQHRGGAKGFLTVLDSTKFAYADFRGNGQYISSGNLHANNKTSIIMLDYPSQQRLKVWAETSVFEVGINQELEARLKIHDHSLAIERIVQFTIIAFDWNCPRHITPRYTEEEIIKMQQGIL